MYTWVNGKLVQADKAMVSVADRGFRFGDGVFETIAVHDGVPYQWELHELRLAKGLRELKITKPAEDLSAVIRKVMHKNALENGFVRLAISRGVGSKGYLPTASKPSLVVEVITKDSSQKDHVKLWLSGYCKPSRSALPVAHKTAQGLNSTLALLEASENGCDEALLINKEGQLCEAASGNLFWFEEEVLYTPSLETGCLNGTTRDAILRLSPYPVRQSQDYLSALKQAEGVFITNCNWGVLPVVELQPNGWQWGINAMHMEFQELYNDDIEQYCSRYKQDWS